MLAQHHHLSSVASSIQVVIWLRKVEWTILCYHCLAVSGLPITWQVLMPP